MGTRKLGGKNQIGLPARRISVKLIKKVLREKKSLDELVAPSDKNAFLHALSTRDRAFVRQICATILRRHGELEKEINLLLDKPLPRKSGDAWEILLCGAAQILYLDVPAHAAIDLSVRLASYDRNAKHFKGLINAILRKLSEKTPKPEENILSNTPNWLLENWQKHYSPQQINAIAGQHLRTPVLDLTCKNDIEKWAEELDAEILPNGSLRLGANGKSIGRIEKLPGYEEGVWWVQDIAASIPVKLLGNVQGKYVLDLCAAPGGKTMQLANGGAKVVSVDQSENRLKRLRENLKRTQLFAEIICGDATKYIPPTPPDIILLDAPCSATGTIRRHPDLPHIKNQNDLKKHIKIQSELLNHAAKILKPGGLLLYCTCSLEKDEGEKQIEDFLARHKIFEINPVQKTEIWDLAETLTETGCMRTLPFHYGEKGGMDGFFIARMEKSTS